MTKLIMFHKINFYKKKGYLKSQISKITGLSLKTVRKYYSMPLESFLIYLEKSRYRKKVFDVYEKEILELYKAQNFRDIPKSSIYDFLEEKYSNLPGNERTLRGYISYLKSSGKLVCNKKSRNYHPVEEAKFGKQMQVDFGEYKFCNGNKIYFTVCILSASRAKFVSFQDKPFNTTDAIEDILESFEYFGGCVEELVIDQDSIFVASENKGNIIYTKEFNTFLDEMKLKMFVCKKADPETKGKVENGVKFVKTSFLSSRIFSNALEANKSALKWLERRANGKISAATNRIPFLDLEKEKEYLSPIKSSIFSVNNHEFRETRKVDPLGFISVSSIKYQLMDEYKNKKVDILKYESSIKVFEINSDILILEIKIPKDGSKKVLLKRNYSKEKQENSLLKLKDSLKKKLNFDGWDRFIELNFSKYRRYFREQFYDFNKKFKKIEDELLFQKAINYCLENKFYTISELNEAYIFFQKENVEVKENPKIHKKIELLGDSRANIVVSEVNIDDYSNLISIEKNLSSEVRV